MDRRSYTRHYIALGGLFVIAAFVQLRLTADFLRALITPDAVAGRILNVGDGTDRVIGVLPNAAEAGLKAGDRVVSVNDVSYVGEGQIAVEARRVGPGGSLKLIFERNGEVRPAMVIVPTADHPRPLGILVLIIFRFITPVFSILLGFFVAAQRPFDRLAWIFLALMLSFAQVSVGTSMQNYALSWDDSGRALALTYIGVLTAT